MPEDDDFDDQLLEEGPAMPDDIDEEDLDLEGGELGEPKILTTTATSRSVNPTRLKSKRST